MKKYVLALCILMSLSACHSPENTVKKARQELSAYQSAPSPTTQAALEKTLATLEEEITKLETQGRTVDASGLRRQLVNLQTDFQAARAVQILRTTRQAIEDIGQAAKDAMHSISETLDPTPTPDAP